MPQCINYSKREIINISDLNNKILIQILGGCENFPEIECSDRYQFLFEDCDESEDIIDPVFWISNEQAKEIANIIRMAFEQDRDILVHCNQGISRSGAVVQAAIDYGFQDTNKFRDPNQYVLKKIKENLI